MRSLGLSRGLICLLLVAIVPAASPGQRPQRQATRQLPPPHYIPSHDYDTQNIKLVLHFDWEREQALGIETITLSPLITNLSRVDLDAANITFNSVKLASGVPLKFVNDATKEKLSITLDHPYQPNDTLNIVVDYHTNGVASARGIAGFGRGLKFIKPFPDDPTRPRQLWSQGETEFNHYWFACYDHPNDFTTTEIVATVERPMIVISNGKLLSTRDNPDDTRTFDWKIDQPHATYLTSIVVGAYVAVEGKYAGIPVISYVYPNELAEGRVTTARLPDMVKFFSEKTGVKYPYAKYSQTMTRDFGGGMENISATTQTDNMIHDARTELDQTSDSLQSHELAHQWFGDYVTCRSWADIWLNESFATYFQAMWDEHSLGHDDFLYLDVKANQDKYYHDWARGVRRPIVTDNYSNPEAVFDTYAYARGAAVLHMLRTMLGEDNWWRAINHYLTKYAHQPVSTEQFRIAIEEATGQSMDWFFDEWVYKMGHPIFRVVQTYDPAAQTLKLDVKQFQKPDPTYEYPQATYFQTPVEIEIGTANGMRVERVTIEPKEEQSFSFAVDGEPLLVNFDYGDTLIKDLFFDKSREALVYQLANDEDLMGRIWALDRLTEKWKATNTAAAEKDLIAKAIASSLMRDKFWGMRFEDAAALQDATGDDVKIALLAATEDKNPQVRARAIQALGARKDASLADSFQLSLGDESYAVVRAAAEALGRTKSPAAYDALLKLLDTSSWRDNVRVAALNGLAALGDSLSLDEALKFSVSGNSVQVRAAAIATLAAAGKDDTRVFPLISEALLKSASPYNAALFNASARALVELGDQRGVAVFEQASKKLESARALLLLVELEEQLKKKAQATTRKAPG
ncbi:MAG TPA: M1 family aminopeptidase [Pyrinomonadaceae bacterium]|nr:M1 family aminopeptidase [Pyrinomonadaceae bacterium]